MPRYFFNVLDRGLSRDDTGTECHDVHAAKVEAIRTSGQMVQEMAESVCDGTEWIMDVTDDRSRVVCVVRIAVEGAPRPA